MSEKILFISSEFPPGPGGIGNQAYHVCKALSEEGYEVTILTQQDYASIEEIKGFNQGQKWAEAIFNFPDLKNPGFFRFLSKFQKAYQVLKQGQFDVCFCSGRTALWLGGVLRPLFSKIKFIAILHGSDINPGSKFIKFVTEILLKQFNSIISISRFTQSLLKLKGQKLEKFFIIPNGIDNQAWHCYSHNETTLKGSPVLLSVGNVNPRKGQQRVIKALPKLKTVFPNLHYHIVGLPSYQENFTELAYKEGVDKLITFHGKVADETLKQFYKASDVLLLLSETQENGAVEGFGIVVLEANCFGLPVIGAFGSGVEEAVEDENNGILVDGDDPVAIKEGIETVFNHKDYFKTKALEWATQHDWKHLIKQYRNVIEN